MSAFPDFPDLRAEGALELRYEDIAQDGRPRLMALPPALGAVWRGVALPPEVRESMLSAGIIPILTRLVVRADDGPFAIEAPFRVSGSFELAHEPGVRGGADRIFLDVRAHVRGPLGRTNLAPPERAGEEVDAGDVLAEHVFTRPFAPKEERKVTSLRFGDGDFVPPRARIFKAPIATIDRPTSPALDAWARDETVLVMGLTHTDSNQHVNSLVYPELFEEAVLRRLASRGVRTPLLARELEIAYRRPSFAGDALVIALQTFDGPGGIEAVGAFFDASDARDTPPERARAYVRMALR